MRVLLLKLEIHESFLLRDFSHTTTSFLTPTNQFHNLQLREAKFDEPAISSPNTDFFSQPLNPASWLQPEALRDGFIRAHRPAGAE
jgi:hypothetical protein